MPTFRYGNPQMVPYTPAAGDLTAGDVVDLSVNTSLQTGVVHTDITNNTLGSIAVGGGVYEGVSLENTVDYELVGWDVTNSKFSSVNTLPVFGAIVSGGGAGVNTTVRVLHLPYDYTQV